MGYNECMSTATEITRNLSSGEANAEQAAIAAGPSVVFTDNAAVKVRELLEEENNDAEMKLRVFIQGGGCSGFQYGFTFDENLEDGDYAITNEGVTLVVDPMSMQYLDKAEIDYTDDIQGARFVIRNPNAQTTCGCGSSFSA